MQVLSRLPLRSSVQRGNLLKHNPAMHCNYGEALKPMLLHPNSVQHLDEVESLAFEFTRIFDIPYY